MAQFKKVSACSNNAGLKALISALEKSANEAYLNSISLELIYSTNPCVKTRTSEAIRYTSLLKSIQRANFALECREIEDSLPDFRRMPLTAICKYAESGNILHWFPCGCGEEETNILLEDSKYYLAVMRYSEEGWIAEARGVRITPRIMEVLTSKGLSIVNY